MKKLLLLTLALTLTLFAAGCASTEAPADDPAPPTTQPEDATPETDAKIWSEEDVYAALTTPVQEEGWLIIACKTIPDLAYDRVGVVLYTDATGQTAGVAFLDAGGAYQQCRLEAPPAADPAFVYEGNGRVTFRLQGPDGTLIPTALTFAKEGSDVTFTAEDLSQ